MNHGQQKERLSTFKEIGQYGGAIMSRLQHPPGGLQSSRRNLIRMSALVGSAMVAKATPAAAGPFSWLEHLFGGGKHRGNQRQGSYGVGSTDTADFHCFLKGTTIRTADGDNKIEDLAAGDLLPTFFGGMCPIQWIGRYRFERSDRTKAWVKDVLPIRVARSALGPDVPTTDLFITQWHALLIDDVLVAAGSLVNGTTITRYDARELDELEFFHIKLERHDVIYAEGAPAETLLEVDESAVNFAEYLRQYGPVTTEETPCAPLFRYGYRRGEMKSCFRSAISPWIDRRQPVDIIRDKLDARGMALLREAEFIS